MISYALVIASIALWPPVRSYPTGAPNCAAQPGHVLTKWLNANMFISIETDTMALVADQTLRVTIQVPDSVPVRGLLLMAVSDSPDSMSGIFLFSIRNRVEQCLKTSIVPRVGFFHF